MIAIRGNWFDGQSSLQTHAVLKIFKDGTFALEAADSNEAIMESSEFTADVSRRIGNTPRRICFQNGGSFETSENEKVDQALSMLRRNQGSLWIHLLESKLRYVLIALVAIGVFAFLGVQYGIPYSARVIAERLPDVVVETAGEKALVFLDKTLFKPSDLPDADKRALGQHFQSVIDHHPDLDLKISLRKGGRIGPNAFALPNGNIVFTDEMVRLAEHHDELLAVLVHEIGHVVHRHGMRRIIQDSILSFAILSITGDASGVSELFLGLPVILTELAYSRGFEVEADDYALQYLKKHGIPPHRFSDLLRRIQTAGNKKAEPPKDGLKWSNYLSTHPDTDERIRRFSGLQ